MVGKQVRHPITGRLIPIIADEHADPELGSGAVKITPGHDFNDFEVGKRAGIKPADMLNMFDAQAYVVQTHDGTIPQELLGLSREDARKAVVERLEAEGAIVRVEDRVIPTPFGDRSGVVIEPWLTDQWYVDAAKLALPALQAVKKGNIKIVPETWAKTWFNWLENIQPWCVSRQLWWGHRIPAWYGWVLIHRMIVSCLLPRTRTRRFTRLPNTTFETPHEHGAGGKSRLRRRRGRSALRVHAAREIPEVRYLAGSGRARHLVLVRAVALRHARLARAR